MMSKHTFSPNSPVWIYQSDRQLSNQECQELQKELDVFTQQWATHGKSLLAETQILYGIFIILIVEGNHQLPSGCSIDASVHLIKDFEQKLNIDFFNRLNIWYKTSDGPRLASTSTLKKLAKAGQISDDTIIFDNSVQTYEQWSNHWQKPIRETWLKKIF